MNGSSLSLWGGFNFVNGEGQGDSLWGSGDIFIDLNGDAQWGAGTGRSGSNSYYKYDYAVVFARNGDTLTGAYNIVSLNGATTVTQTYDWSGTLFDWSNPFRVGDGSQALPNGGGNYVYTPDADATGLGLVGGTHNRLTVDLSALGDLSGALFHFTIEWGNDGINGHNSVPDGGGTALSLFGLGVGAFGFLRRRLN